MGHVCDVLKVLFSKPSVRELQTKISPFHEDREAIKVRYSTASLGKFSHN